MTSIDPRYARLCRLFVETRQLGPAEREHRIAACRVTDADLARDLEDMLKADVAPGDAATMIGDSHIEADAAPQYFGRYRCLRRVGSGGSSLVFEAIQPHSDRRVALKVLRPTAPADGAARMAYEARVLAALDHPGIPRLFDSGEVRIGPLALPYLAMEFVSGRRLDDDELALDQDGVIGLVHSLAETLSYLHGRGIVHRDVKPANIVVTSAGLSGFTHPLRAMLIDFGAAVESGPRTTSEPPSSGSRSLVGTLEYLAPELIAAPGRTASPACDIYSLGVCAFEMLTRRRPIELRGQAIAAAIRTLSETVPHRLREVQPDAADWLDDLLARMLDREPAHRPDAATIASELRDHLGQPPQTPSMSPPWLIEPKPKRRMARRSLPAIGIMSLAAMVIAGLAMNHRATRGVRDAYAASIRALGVTRPPTLPNRTEATVAVAVNQASTLRTLLESCPDLVNTYPELLTDPLKGSARTLSGVHFACDAVPHYVALIDAMRRSGASRCEVAPFVSETASVMVAAGQVSEANHLHHAAIADADACGDPELRIMARLRLGCALRMSGDAAGSFAVMCEARGIADRTLPAGHPVAMQASAEVAGALIFQHRFEEGDVIAADVIARWDRGLAPTHYAGIMALKQRGIAARERGDCEMARDFIDEAIERDFIRRGGIDIDGLELRRLRAGIDWVDGRLEDAREGFVVALALASEMTPPPVPDIEDATNSLGVVLRDLGQFDTAERLLRQAWEWRTARLGPDADVVLASEVNLSKLLIMTNRNAEALVLASRAATLGRASAGQSRTILEARAAARIAAARLGS